jgi:crossover junction endodeoxyribonuclease RusA
VNRNVPAAIKPASSVLVMGVGVNEWSLHLPFTTAPNLNDRKHYMVKAKIVREWRGATSILGRSLRIPACERIKVELHYVPAQERRRDPDNLVSALKPCCDGLVDAGIVPDDTERFVERVFPIIHKAHPTEPVQGSRFFLRVVRLR